MDFEKMSKIEMLKWMATTAKAEGRHVGVSDIRFITTGIPCAVNDEFVYFDEGYEVDETGQLGSKPSTEKLAKGGKVIFWQAICTLEFIATPK